MSTPWPPSGEETAPNDGEREPEAAEGSGGEQGRGEEGSDEPLLFYAPLTHPAPAPFGLPAYEDADLGRSRAEDGESLVSGDGRPGPAPWAAEGAGTSYRRHAYPYSEVWTPQSEVGAPHHVLEPMTPHELAWASAAHWLPIFTHWVGPLVVLLTVGRRSSRVRAEAMASLNWEITVALMLAGATLLRRVVGPGVSAGLVIGIILLSALLRLAAVREVRRGRHHEYALALPIVV